MWSFEVFGLAQIRRFAHRATAGRGNRASTASASTANTSMVRGEALSRFTATELRSVVTAGPIAPGTRSVGKLSRAQRVARRGPRQAFHLEAPTRIASARARETISVDCLFTIRNGVQNLRIDFLKILSPA
jgi:hypothetical protein